MQIDKSSDTKQCSKCKVEKPISEFSKNKRKVDGLEMYCKSCRNEYYKVHRDKMRLNSMKHYHDNLDDSRAYHRDRKHFYYTRDKAKRDEFINSIKTPCVKCGEQRLHVIQFHHINANEKVNPVSSFNTKEKILEEAAKCVCLCANCHTEFHYLYGKDKGDKSEQLREYLSGVVNR